MHLSQSKNIGNGGIEYGFPSLSRTPPAYQSRPFPAPSRFPAEAYFRLCHSVRCMHAVVRKVHGYCFKNSVFYKEKKVPNPLEASTEGLKSIFNAKTIF